MASNGDGAVSRARTSQVRLIDDSAPGMIDTGRPDGYLDFFGATEHELATQELRRRAAYPAEAQRLGHTGSFRWNVVIDEHSWSGETFRIFEFAKPSKVLLPVILERVHPHDRPSVKIAMDAAANREELDLEYLHIVARPQRDTAGGIEVIGAVMDIAARKRTEVELRRRKAHLADAQRLSRTGTAGMEARGAQLGICPLYIREWVTRETTGQEGIGDA